jgi:prevent-host-death family protein
MHTLTSVDAQNRFGELLDTAQREPVAVTRRGRVSAYVVSSDAYHAIAAQAATQGGRVAAYFDAIAAFRGQGRGGAVARLRADRATDKNT